MAELFLNTSFVPNFLQQFSFYVFKRKITMNTKHLLGILRGQVQWGGGVGGVRSPLTSADLTNDLKRDRPAVTTALRYCCIVVL